MLAVAFSIFGLEIRWYGLLIASAVLIGTVLALKEAKRKGVKEETLIDMLLFAVPAAIIGARAYYVIFMWDYYSKNPSQILNIRGGGLAIHGVIIAGTLVAIIFAKVRKESFWKLADIVAPSLILGQAIGRWGNFANQEAHGGPTDLPWGIMIDGVKVHPTFLYESIWNLLVFGFLLWYRRKKATVEGEIYLLYLILYSVGRFFIEGLRTDSLMLGPFRVAQLISLAIIMSGGAYLIWKKKRIKAE
ncbi:prolipoprotein diacylglyceryl transferase [Gudongella oleilytica]|uniref:prolipoprotein diacylglyceryl transferase n=1 Tax=Gudongella oleilytica TaxID=1582259 RepID=UPI000EDEB20D|nr:prolipoprotein diacylglyceryl transferase [Gudongella oleilytica]MDY0255659.1 prolipoprotein diacylglyceryl transferase [Gudongella oleilytica]HCO19428.1 prolipoprotein diacylglyceryl transferase [Tissierellales bacterium]